MSEEVIGVKRVRIEQVGGNSYLFVKGKDVMIVDTGLPGSAEQILRALEALGSGKSVKAIVLTHYHIDHTGSASDLKKITGATVYAHEEDAPFISGEREFPLPPSVPRERYSSYRTVDVDQRLREGDDVFGFKIIHIPGHTPGSIALHGYGMLFSGDTLNARGGSIQGTPAQYDWNRELADRAVKRLLELDFDILLPGHGDPVVGNASALAKRYLLGTASL